MEQLRESISWKSNCSICIYKLKVENDGNNDDDDDDDDDDDGNDWISKVSSLPVKSENKALLK